MIKFFYQRNNFLIILYSLSFISLILAPNNQGIMPSNYSIVPLSYFFILFTILVVVLFILDRYFSPNLNSLIYCLLLIFIFDFIKIKYDLFSYSSFLVNIGINSSFILLLKKNLFYFSIIFSIIFFLINYRFIFLGKVSKLIVIMFFPFIVIFFSHYIFHYYNNFKFYSKLKINHEIKNYVKKNNVIILFDELDNKILNLELDNLPSFKKLLKNSIHYTNVITPGLETFDVIPNLINLKSDVVNLDTNLKLKNKNNYLKLIDQINENEKNLFSLLNKDNDELLVLSFFHKLCKHFKNYFGECFEHKYYKKPEYRNLVKNKEILKVHINNYKLNFKIFDYYLNNNSLKSAFLHLQVPHTPYFFDPIEYNYKLLDIKNQNQLEKGYLGGLILADKYLDYILKYQEKYEYDIIVISDHGLRSDYKELIGVANLEYQELHGRSLFVIKKYGLNLAQEITEKVNLERVIQNYL